MRLPGGLLILLLCTGCATVPAEFRPYRACQEDGRMTAGNQHRPGTVVARRGMDALFQPDNLPADCRHLLTVPVERLRRGCDVSAGEPLRGLACRMAPGWGADGVP